MAGPKLLLLATRNRAKAERLRRLCDGLGFDLVDGATLQAGPDVEEDAASHLGNAERKAVVWSRLYPQPAIASDGGLAIPALGDGWTSLVTRRESGGDVSDEEHAARLLRRMRDLQGNDRCAYWTEAVAVARSGMLIGAWEASGLRGEIATDYVAPAGGTNGFWVSGLWVTPDGRRYWELGQGDLAAAEDPWETITPKVRDLLARLAAP